MNLVRSCVSLATAALICAGSVAAAGAEEKPSDSLGYSREECEQIFDSNGKVVGEKCRKVEIGSSNGSAKAFDTVWEALGSSEGGSSGKGTSQSDGSSDVPALVIPVAILGTLQDFSIRLV